MESKRVRDVAENTLGYLTGYIEEYRHQAKRDILVSEYYGTFEEM